MPKNTLEKINLLPQDPFFESPIGRILNWASTVGRYIIILTEFLIVAVIAAKFKLDRDLTDLNAAINLRSNMIASFGDLEKNVRSAQERIEFLRKQDSLSSVSGALNIIKRNLPREAVLSSLRIEDTSVRFTGRAFTLSALTGVATALRQDPGVQQLVLENISQNQDGLTGYDFEISLVLKK